MGDDLFDLPQAGEHLRGVMIGPPVGGYIALWDEHDVGFWRLSGSPPSMLGAGAMIRMGDETGRYRELGLLNEESGLLVLRDRDQGPEATPVVQLVPLTPVTMEEAKAESLEDDISVARWLGDIAFAAATRGEWLAIHPGSWQGPFEPIVVVELLRDAGGRWSSAVRATPVPYGAEFWSDHTVGDDWAAQQIATAASSKALMDSGIMAVAAFLSWGIHPLMLGMTFGPNPHGPWSELV
ncbi:hypothetical protein DP939_29275 [Spongiactinospora rosea]|uniref:Uncharacterized protein n=1 Tax=Spongiactinospora rosea TaxID=2248750 RepID=A0A366LTR5_9ACTN|nr:hypothetical protein [Spongiactinospora rosea]RBQ16759.1 hypothetical protein DP939_29275 [Spongiactinospora rosea]